MAKGQLRGNKETKKPKADMPKGHVSAYKQSQVKKFHLSHIPVARLRRCFSAKPLPPYIRRSNSQIVKPIAKMIYFRLAGFVTDWADSG